MAENNLETLLPLLTPLLPAAPSLLSLLKSSKPFANPLLLSAGQLQKFLGKLNSAVLSREVGLQAWTDKAGAWAVATEIVDQDLEGHVIGAYGKQWVQTLVPLVSNFPATHLAPLLDLLSTLFKLSPQYPAFSREAALPLIPKFSHALLGLIQKPQNYNLIPSLLAHLPPLLALSPAPHRPLLAHLRPLLFSLLLSPSPSEIRKAAASTLASLHVVQGKTAAAAAWASDMRDALGGIAAAMDGLSREAWEEDPLLQASPASPATFPVLPTDPMEACPVSLVLMDGYLELVVALLRFKTQRPVPVPVGLLVAAALRCMRLTTDTSVKPYIVPAHQAELLAALPGIWKAGAVLLASVSVVAKDHLLPHLGNIFEHSVYLLERLQPGMHQSRCMLIRLHTHLLTMYAPALIPASFPTRLLRHSLTALHPVLPQRSSQVGFGTVETGKRGKKRARGGEDGLVGSFEGRAARALGKDEIAVALAALQLTALLHATPLLAPALHTLSLRLHLSLYMSHPPPAISAATRTTLQAAVNVASTGSSSRGWIGIVISVLDSPATFDGVIHPALPPVAVRDVAEVWVEKADEAKMRLELGLVGVEDGDEDEDDEVDIEVDVEKLQAVAVAATRAAGSATSAVAPAVVAPVFANAQPASTVAPASVPLATPAPVASATILAPTLPVTTPAELADPAIPFMSAPSVVQTQSQVTMTSAEIVLGQGGDEDDEPIPELDDASSDEEMDE